MNRPPRLARLLDDALLTNESAMTMMTVFAGLALLLAAVGIYGVVSYAVGQQMRDFGIRRALGATPADILALVLRRGGSLVAAGVAIGLAGALGLARLMQAHLFGVSAGDPPTGVQAGPGGRHQRGHGHHELSTPTHATPYVYFLRTPGPPEVCAPGTPLTYRDVAVYRIGPGGTFDLDRWKGTGGISYTLSAEAGVLTSSRDEIY